MARQWEVEDGGHGPGKRWRMEELAFAQRQLFVYSNRRPLFVVLAAPGPQDLVRLRHRPGSYHFYLLTNGIHPC